MVTARATAAEAFVNAKPPACELTALTFNNSVSHHIPSDAYKVRMPREDEKINTLYDNEVAIPLDHFDFGWHFPLLPEVVEILNFFGIVPAQIPPVGIATIYSFVNYLRMESISFSLQVFRSLFYVRSKVAKGEGRTGGSGQLYIGSKKLQLLNIPNKVHNWNVRFAFFSGELGGLLMRPTSRSEKRFQEPKLDGVELKISQFLTGASLDIEYYVPLAPQVAHIRPDDSKPLRPYIYGRV